MRIVRLISCLSVALVLSLGAIAQKNFAKEADAAFANEAFYTAKDLYKKAYPKIPKAAEKARIVFQIAECYRYMTDSKQAAVWYEKSIKAKYSDPIAHFHLANVRKEQGDYAEALKAFNKYKSLAPDDPRGAIGASSCEDSQSWKDNPTRHEVNPEVLLNSKQYDFSPQISSKRGNMLIFTSSREGAEGSKTDNRTGESFQDLFTSTRDKKGKWSEPTPVVGEGVNSEHHEGSVTLNKKKTVMYFTRCPNEKNKNLGCDIWKTTKKGQGWAVPTKMEIRTEGDDTTSFGHPCISPKEDFLLFASDMPGGKGGKDIWMMTYDKKAKTWSKPSNLGAPVNTPGDDMFPFIREDGNLYFASNGHPGMGGLDIFKATLDGDKKWTKVENMQYPINSEGHDYGITFENGPDDRGYFTSNRAGGKGQDDIYNFRIPPVLFTLQVLVSDKDTKKPIPDATLKIVGTDNSSYEVKTDANGGFNFELIGDSEDRYIKGNTTYSIQVDKENFLVSKDQISTVGVKESTTFISEINLQFASKETVIKLPEVRYSLGKAELQVIEGVVDSKDSLSTLFRTLIENPTINIELQAHTDHRGSASANDKLSQARAQSCVDFLVSLGIPIERMQARGYGENKPRAGLAPADIEKMKTKEEREAAHQKNRRTEFTVLNFDYAPANTYGVSPGFEQQAEEFLKGDKPGAAGGAQ